MTSSGVPPLVDVYPDEPGRASPFDPGGVGRLFVHLSNRNQCSYLMDRLPGGGPEGMDRLGRAFPMGYSTLFVLQKVCAVARDRDGVLTEDRPVPEHLRTQPAYAVLVHPRWSAIGGSAMVARDLALGEALEQARGLCNEPGRSVVVAIVTDEISWH